MALGVAIIGAGMIANIHVTALQEIPGARITGVWSRNAEATAKFAAKHGIKAFKSYEDVLADAKTDIISLCLPPGLHVDFGLQAAAAGKHLIVEKPMDIDAAKARRLIEVYRAKNLVLSVIFQNRFTPAAQRVKAALDAGLLGRLILGDAYVKWYRSPEYYANGAWRGTWNIEGGGALINQAIHTIDLLQWFMGGVKSVSGMIKTSIHKIETEDLGVAAVEYHNGALGVIEGSTAITPGYKERIEIHGTKGSFILEGGIVKEWKVEGCREEDYIDTQPISYGATNSPAISSVNHKAQMLDILRAVEQGKDPLVTGEEGLKSLEIVLGIYESSRKGQKIQLA
ncbi:oxidoreductase domain protein [Thermosinus carboxydivorans Nor1]|uniref:Oxidoreductase domain protein n=1 Tax=Thermosinus carboxydivorans Nor1 TaxID=401526 RepID=A1HMT2_9FIRM|nr:Gfo/Idh/MocA family oxidoreductase [Thermosinus carboxydivorans]EAX48567.1 oxidoreductase domain protein [Thermosinus carboxydivorans Nor1]